MRRRGRPVLGAICGLLFGFFVALDLVVFGLVALDSIVVTIVIVAGLLLGLILGLTAPLGRRRRAGAATTATEPLAP